MQMGNQLIGILYFLFQNLCRKIKLYIICVLIRVLVNLKIIYNENSFPPNKINEYINRENYEVNYFI